LYQFWFKARLSLSENELHFPKMTGRRHGTTNNRFDPEALTSALKPMAELKKPPCDFEFEVYGKTRRAQAPDREGLEHYAPLLTILVKFATRSLPLKAHLKIVWLQLQNEHQIKSKLHENLSSTDWVDMCVDRVSIACNHLRALTQSRTIYVSQTLKALMALVDIGDQVRSTTTTIASPSARTPATPAPTPTPTPTTPASLRRSLQVQFSDASSCAICSIDCKCEDCNKPELVSLISPSPAKSDTSKAAEENENVVPAARGGQKRAATEAKDEAKKEGPVPKSRRSRAEAKVAKRPSRAEASSDITGAS
jgi:hypothetical protein